MKENKLYIGTINEVTKQVRKEAHEERVKKAMIQSVDDFLYGSYEATSSSDLFTLREQLTEFKDLVNEHPEAVIDLLDKYIEVTEQGMLDSFICPVCGGNIELISSSPQFAFGRSGIRVEIDEDGLYACDKCGATFEE